MEEKGADCSRYSDLNGWGMEWSFLWAAQEASEAAVTAHSADTVLKYTAKPGLSPQCLGSEVALPFLTSSSPASHSHVQPPSQSQMDG